MGESSDSVSIDIDVVSLRGKEYVVKTSKGSISVFVSGDQEKPALITYPDVALNHMSCFNGLFFFPETASLLLHNFCIYHIDAPGHELGADVISSDVPVLNVDDLSDQVAEVLDFFMLKEVLCLGVTAGAYILTLFAVRGQILLLSLLTIISISSIGNLLYKNLKRNKEDLPNLSMSLPANFPALQLKYKERVLGLILVSPICKVPSWTEWIYNKVLLNLLYFYGMCDVMKECLLQRYFSKELRRGMLGTGSEIIRVCEEVGFELLDERQSLNVMRFLQAMNERCDIRERLRNLQCKTLIFVGESSPFHAESLYMSAKIDSRSCTLVEVQECGSLVTEEHPYAMLIPLELFLMNFGVYRHQSLPAWSSPGSNPGSPSSRCCIAPELLSPESLGVKLKPIKTRVDIESR